MTEPFVARPSRWRLLLLTLLSAILAAAGLVAAAEDHPIIGVVCTIFFGACMVLWFRRWRDEEVQIRVDENGVYWRQWSETPIPWRTIEAMEPFTYRFHRSMRLYVKKPENYRSTTLLGRLAPINTAMGGGNICLDTMGTDRSFDELSDALEAYWIRSKECE